MLVGVVGNPQKVDVPDAVRSLLDVLKRRGVGARLHEDLLDAFPELGNHGEFVPAAELLHADVVIAFGGDGTMLSTGRFLAGSGIPLLGFNLGKLGFLAEFSVDSIEQTIDDFLGGACRVVHRSLLEATFPENPEVEPLVGLNDIVIDKRGGALMVQLEAYINGDYLGSYNADGLILATPTGSTAYALAVGGPIVTPNAHVTVIAPIAPHMLTARPVVVPDDALIDIYPKGHDRSGETVHVYADGQVHRNIPMPTRVSITRYKHTVCLVKRTATTYFDILRAKLLWGREPVLNVPPVASEGKS